MKVKDKVKRLKMLQKDIALCGRVIDYYASECEKTKVLTETRQRYIQLQEEADMIEIQIMRSIAPAVITSNDYDIIMDALIHNIDRRMISEKYNVSYNRVAHKISNVRNIVSCLGTSSLGYSVNGYLYVSAFYADKTNINITVTADVSNNGVKVMLKYTKTTD